jgi:adenine-specific DNA-methyltransferase
MVAIAPVSPDNVEEQVDLLRLEASRRYEREAREGLGQFFTPLPTARLMASLVGPLPDSVDLIDAGAGVGSLTASWVAEVCRRPNRPKQIRVTAYEIDRGLIPYLSETLALCQTAAAGVGVAFSSRVREEDFIEAATGELAGGVFTATGQRYDAAILNPPYQKLATRSHERQLLRSAGMDAGNLYAAFVLLAARLLRADGQMVAITPRSFCNGPYFTPFRLALLQETTIRALHVFHARNRAFRDDAVLQENVIVHAVKIAATPGDVVAISSSEDADGPAFTRTVPFAEVVRPDDPESVIYVPDDEAATTVSARMGAFTSTLDGLGLTVSTGRVVDFRARPWLRWGADEGTVPLLYPGNLVDGRTSWPLPSRKPNAILRCPDTEPLLIPSATYVLVKRFSSKEEPHRLVAAVFEPETVEAPVVGFENHLNYVHVHGNGVPRTLAFGLAAYLNSPLVDDYFRQFSGHTQVNAADLRRLPYPSRAQLEQLGQLADGGEPEGHLSEELRRMAGETVNREAAQGRIEEALGVLRVLGLPRGQLNERSALTLLALLDLGPQASWSSAQAPLRGITELMEFMTEVYGRRYAPNTRETVRRQTVHQFLDAGLIEQNPDNPSRPTNSPNTVYRVEAGALDMLRTYGTAAWDQSLRAHLAAVATLHARYAAERAMTRIPVLIGDGTVNLSPGGQNVLIKQVVEEFGSRFTPGGKVLYIGDADKKWMVFEQADLAALGVVVEAHGKMPDVVIHYPEKNWLVLVEAVTTHGPVDPKRHRELRALFAESTARLVFVTAFLDRGTMSHYLRDISWETEVWVAEAPSHLIHFNGDRFMGPYGP